MLQTVRVRLRKPTQLVTCLARDITLDQGDACIVKTERGQEYALCIAAPSDCPEEDQARYADTVVRKANYNDELNHQQLTVDEGKAKAVCVGKIVEHRLPMRLVDVEYTLDKRKVVFYFTADERVDFRELVRDLAHELKTRIELRHIQVRDKSRIVGGMAACGRELCCATWLSEFVPISMKMAKRQNLSLNPTKISGQCGRLMCCLSYEDCNYSPKKKKQSAAPNTQEPEGEGPEPEQDESSVPSEGFESALDKPNGAPARPPRSPKPGKTACEIAPESAGGEPGGTEAPGKETGGPAASETGKPRRRSRRRRRHRAQPSAGGAGAPSA